jgi:G:T/U-mismatch repair DNA glycosylase
MKPLPDILGKDLVVVFCGLNPGLGAAAAGHHFVGHNNRFWQVLHLAGFTPIRMNPMQNGLLLNHGYGLTTVVARPTAGADEVSISELSAAGALLYRKIQTNRPRFLAFSLVLAAMTIWNRYQLFALWCHYAAKQAWMNPGECAPQPDIEVVGEISVANCGTQTADYLSFFDIVRRAHQECCGTPTGALRRLCSIERTLERVTESQTT